MEWEFIAPMVMSVVFIITTGAVILLRPLSRRLGDLLEVMAAERKDPQLKEELAKVRELQEILSERLALLEERQEFTDALLRGGEKQRLGGGQRIARDRDQGGEAER